MGSTTLLGLKYGTVAITDYDPAWEHAFRDESALLSQALSDVPCEIEHIGSTAVPGLKAKPILDIAIGVADDYRIENCIPQIEALGYLYRGASDDVGHVLVREIGNQVRTHHVHIVQLSQTPWELWLTFRDYLRKSARARRTYSAEKEALAERHPLDRNAYTEAKNEVGRAVACGNTP